MRDVKYSGLHGKDYDYNMVMKTARVWNNQIIYHAKQAMNIKQLFDCRADLHRTLYNHKSVHCIDLMICDILLEANTVFDFKKKVWDPVEYIKLSDNILFDIKMKDDPSLKRAKDLIT